MDDALSFFVSDLVTSIDSAWAPDAARSRQLLDELFLVAIVDRQAGGREDVPSDVPANDVCDLRITKDPHQIAQPKDRSQQVERECRPHGTVSGSPAVAQREINLEQNRNRDLHGKCDDATRLDYGQKRRENHHHRRVADRTLHGAPVAEATNCECHHQAADEEHRGFVEELPSKCAGRVESK